MLKMLLNVQEEGWRETLNPVNSFLIHILLLPKIKKSLLI